VSSDQGAGQRPALAKGTSPIATISTATTSPKSSWRSAAGQNELARFDRNLRCLDILRPVRPRFLLETDGASLPAAARQLAAASGARIKDWASKRKYRLSTESMNESYRDSVTRGQKLAAVRAVLLRGHFRRSFAESGAGLIPSAASSEPGLCLEGPMESPGLQASHHDLGRRSPWS